MDQIIWEIPLSITYQLIAVSLWKKGANLRRSVISGKNKEANQIRELLGV